jgi:AcrR family transcriptional regulator
MATPPKGVDRRVQRTRQLLRQAFLEVSQEKGVTAVSVLDITERANVNRGTFYAHYPDKYALIEELTREEFHRRITSKLPSRLRRDKETLHVLIQAVLESFQSVHRQCRPPDAIHPLIQRAIHEELTGLLLTWLKHEESGARQWRIPEETIANIMSWAIFGAASRWCQEATTISSKQMADDVFLVIVEGVARLAPEAFPT